MNNFTPEQLNRLNIEAAEMVGWRRIPYKQAANYDAENTSEHRHYLCWVDDKDMFQFFEKYHDFDLHADSVWNPVDKDSAQAQNYLIPRLLNRKLEIDIEYRQNRIKIYKVGFDKFKGRQAILWKIKKTWTNPDEINATITEVCILAMKKLSESCNS